MTTGDLSNNLRKLSTTLRGIKYDGACDVSALAEGLATAYLPLYHYAFTNYSPAVSQLILDKGIELYGKSDARFMEAVYKILRDVFAYKPPITKEQFFAKGFAERKVIMCVEVLQMVKDKNNELNPGKPKTSLKTSVRPKSADTKHVSLAVPKTKRSSFSKNSSRELDSAASTSGPQVVNELISAPASEPVRHVANVHNQSVPVRHTAAHGGTNTSQISDVSESLPSKPSCIVSKHAALNRPVKHVSIQSPRDVRIISPEGASPEYNRFTSPGGGHGCSFETQSTPDKDFVSPESFRSVRDYEMTPSIKKVCPKSVEVVTIPRGQEFEEPSIIEIQAPTSDSVLHGPIPIAQPDLATLSQTVDMLKNQVMELAQSTNGDNSEQERKLGQVYSSLENLTARILLLENRMSILEAKLGDVQEAPPPRNAPAPSQSFRQVPRSVDQPVPLRSAVQKSQEPQVQAGLEMSHNSPALFAGPGDSFAEEMRSLGSSQRAQSIKNSADFSLNYSPIRKVTNGVVGTVMSANEDTFALETEDDARRASTPTAGGTPECDASLQCNISHLETRDVVSRINNMIKQTTLMIKDKPVPGQLGAPEVDISN